MEEIPSAAEETAEAQAATAPEEPEPPVALGLSASGGSGHSSRPRPAALDTQTAPSDRLTVETSPRPGQSSTRSRGSSSPRPRSPGQSPRNLGNAQSTPKTKKTKKTRKVTKGVDEVPDMHSAMASECHQESAGLLETPGGLTVPSGGRAMGSLQSILTVDDPPAGSTMGPAISSVGAMGADTPSANTAGSPKGKRITKKTKAGTGLKPKEKYASGASAASNREPTMLGKVHEAIPEDKEAEDTDAMPPDGDRPPMEPIKSQKSGRSTKTLAKVQWSLEEAEDVNKKRTIDEAEMIEMLSQSLGVKLLHKPSAGVLSRSGRVRNDLRRTARKTRATCKLVKHWKDSASHVDDQGDSPLKISTLEFFRLYFRDRIRNHILNSKTIQRLAKPAADVLDRLTVLRSSCIFISLFFPDLFVLLQVPNNWVLDTIMTIVLLVFWMEFIILSLTDPSYFLSYFCFMDFLSALSIITDISYLLGESATEPMHIRSGETQSSKEAILRLVRIARLASRAGRLCRTSRALWVILGEVEKRNNSNVLSVLTTQVRSTLTTRLSFIMFAVGCAVPVTLMFRYPVADEAILVWPSLLNKDAEKFFNNSLSTTRLMRNLASFSLFFEKDVYGPQHVCLRRSVHDEFDCNLSLYGLTWKIGFEPTERGNSQWIVSHENFQATYDMSSPQRMEAVGNIFLIVMMMFCLIVFAIDLNRNVTRLALNPLGRVLIVVQYHCSKIFNYTEDIVVELEQHNQRQENYDVIDLTNESMLIETIVEKLIIIVERAVAKLEPAYKPPKTDDEKLMLCFQENWQNTIGAVKAALNVAAAKSDGGTLGRQESMLVGRLISKGFSMQSLPSVKTNVSNADSLSPELLASLDTPFFNSLEVPQDCLAAVASCILNSSDGIAGYIKQNVRKHALSAFLNAVSDGYNLNPFHNFAHALDVLATTSRYCKACRALKYLSEEQVFALLISAITHDVGHLGVNNSYLVENTHELALTYNDVSPLENMSLAKTFAIMTVEGQNILKEVESNKKKTIRKDIIETVLCTDITKHSPLINQLALFYQLNSGELSQGMNSLTPSSCELLAKEAPMFQKLFIHVADNSVPMKPWDLCYRYANLAMDEFFAQGELEKAAGMPVQILNNSDNMNRLYLQVGWISHVSLPMAEVVLKVFPPLHPLAENLSINFEKWMFAYQGESRPTEDEAWQQGERVRMVAQRCADLKTNVSWRSEKAIAE